tara:strand:- start:1591 stop:2169 length:579 start_codon:yes stop_codon:yes gene_type:complete
MPTNFDTLFYETKLIEDFEEYMEEEELEINEDNVETHVDNFISNHYWGDLNKYFMNPDNTNDISLLMYLKNSLNECDDLYEDIIEYMNEEKNINYIREKLYNYAIFDKLQDLVYKKYENKKHKFCSHKYECGCNKKICIGCKYIYDDINDCVNESCRNYYNYRNDNCRCFCSECPYCVSLNSLLIQSVFKKK